MPSYQARRVKDVPAGCYLLPQDRSQVRRLSGLCTSTGLQRQGGVIGDLESRPWSSDLGTRRGRGCWAWPGRSFPRNGGGRGKWCQAGPAGRAEAALEGLERGGTAAPVSPPHTEGARRLPGVTLREGWARVSAQAHQSEARARSPGRALRGQGRASEGASFRAGVFIQTALFCYCEERH